MPFFLWQDQSCCVTLSSEKDMQESTKNPLFIKGWKAMAARTGYSISGLKILVRKGIFPPPARPTYRTVLWDSRVAEQWRDSIIQEEIIGLRKKK